MILFLTMSKLLESPGPRAPLGVVKGRIPRDDEHE